MATSRFASVALNVPLLPPLTYRIAETMSPCVGDRCVVPLGRRQEVGLIVALSDQTTIDPKKQKTIIRLLNETEPVSEIWLKLTRFAADYYQHSWGEVTIAALPTFFKTKPGPKYEQSLERLRKPYKVKKNDKPSVVLTLNDEQQMAVQAVEHAKGFEPYVLHGVTGSGKTEVYLRMMESLFAKKPDAQVLFLVPEINLTPQLEARIRNHFLDKPMASLHSGLANGERAKAWLAAKEKRIQILVGTRMAIFSDMPNLELIVVDEEHDLSYKAGDGIRYSARDLAVKLAQLRQIPVILGSATPSLETWSRVKNGHYNLLSLTKRAVPGASLPTLLVVNPKNKKLIKGLTPEVIDAISETLQKKEQVIIFLNRRGYAPVLTCPSCGWLSKCPHCSTYAVYHKFHGKLVCHHCGWSTPVYSRCPDCGNVDLLPMGAGTQRIEETLEQLWPQARILRIDRDTTQRKNAAKEAFDAVHAGEVDILVGTQMVAKGHDFQKVSLVVVLNIDAQLVSSNPRSEERAFANLMQVAGRAGRFGLPAKMIVQSRFGDREIFAALAQQNYNRYADYLLKVRKEENSVPFVCQALLMADDANIGKALEFLKQALKVGSDLLQQQQNESVVIYDPIPMALMKLADKERAQLLVEASSRIAMGRFLRQWYRQLCEIGTSVHWTMDVDPMDV